MERVGGHRFEIATDTGQRVSVWLQPDLDRTPCNVWRTSVPSACSHLALAHNRTRWHSMLCQRNQALNTTTRYTITIDALTPVVDDKLLTDMQGGLNLQCSMHSGYSNASVTVQVAQFIVTCGTPCLITVVASSVLLFDVPVPSLPVW